MLCYCIEQGNQRRLGAKRMGAKSPDFACAACALYGGDVSLSECANVQICKCANERLCGLCPLWRRRIASRMCKCADMQMCKWAFVRPVPSMEATFETSRSTRSRISGEARSGDLAPMRCALTKVYCAEKRPERPLHARRRKNVYAVDVVAFQAATSPIAYTQAASLRSVTWACEWWPLAFPSAADFQFRPLVALNEVG